jgi:hypothetical protein
MNEINQAIFDLITPKGFFMLGAKNQVYCNKENYISFKISGSKKINYIKIQYKGGKDLYNLFLSKFSVVKGEVKHTNKVEHNGIYENMVRELIEKETGLYLKLF